MKKVLAVLLMLAVGFGGFLAGRLTAPSEDGVTFYAEITQISEKVLLVEGLEVNDINHRGSFYLTVDEKTGLFWRGTEIGLEELQTGNRIAVTYTGSVMETYPARIPSVLRLTLLEDEK